MGEARPDSPRTRPHVEDVDSRPRVVLMRFMPFRQWIQTLFPIFHMTAMDTGISPSFINMMIHEEHVRASLWSHPIAVCATQAISCIMQPGTEERQILAEPRQDRKVATVSEFLWVF
jgi:hypothetical protein